MQMDLGLEGRRAIVTGGSSGIGFETARQFLEEGARVLITGRDADKLAKARDGLNHMVEDGRMRTVLADSALPLDGKADRMIQLACDAGGTDNITVVLVQVGAGD